MIEYRQFKIDKREAANNRSVSGYGAVFNSMSEDLGFYETIDPEAIDADTIKRSDVFATFNHDPEKIFARSKYGIGSLELDVDEHGLHYRFDAPNNDLGNTLLEFLERGDIDSSSFAFTVAEDAWEKRDGQIFRTIKKIDQLFDVSPVWSPAYAAAECQKRNKPSDYEKEINSLDENMDDKKIQELEEEVKALREMLEELKPKAEEEKPEAEEQKEEPKAEEEKPAEEQKGCGEPGCDEEKKPEEAGCGEPGCDEEKKPEEAGCGEEQKEDEERNKPNINKSNIRNMETKKFNLVKELRESLETGKKIAIGGVVEDRGYSVTDQGEHVVPESTLDIVKPLYAKNVLVKAGAHFFGGLPMGDQRIPVMTAGQLKFKGENGTADDGSGSFSHVEMKPKRLTGVFPISLELINQDENNGNIEANIRADISNAFSQKLESSILGTSYGAAQPDSLGYILADTATAVATFADVAGVEAAAERLNYDGSELKYVISPEMKAALRTTAKGSNANKGFIFENGEIDGTATEVTSHVPNKKGYYGKWNDLYIAQFGPIYLETVRDSASLADGKVNVVFNAFVDWKLVRNDSIKMSYIN